MNTIITYSAALVVMIFTACSGRYSENSAASYSESESYATSHAPTQAVDPALQNPQNSTPQIGGLVMHEYVDKESGLISSRFPAPTNWKLNTNARKNEPKITGPHNLNVYQSENRVYSFPTDPNMQQMYRNYNMPLNPPVGLNGLIQSDLKPRLENDGMRLSKRSLLPDATRNYRSFLNQLYTFQSSNLEFAIEGTEWIDREGKPMFVAVTYIESRDAQSQAVTWMYNYIFLTANADYYEEAKSAYIHALEKQEFNPAYIAHQNQKTITMRQQNNMNTQQSWAAHNQRMRNNQAAFDAQQRTHRETYDAINKSSMDAYYNRSASMDRNQNATINSIYEQQNVTNPTNGQTYQVEGYYNQYWMNSNGEYIGSDNSLFNPNQDSGFNDRQWEEAIPNPYGE